MPKGKYIRTPETREKLRQIGLRRVCSEETKEKLRQINLGKKYPNRIPPTKEAIEKRRQVLLGRKRSPEFCGKHSWTLESRKKARQSRLGKKHSPETIEKLRQSQSTPEARERQRQIRLKQHFPTKMTSIEVALHDEFKKRRLKFEMHKTMFGRFQPDFVFESAKLIVQADGNYWHSLPDRIESDKHFDELAHDAGYTVFRFNETVIKQNAVKCARTVARFVRDHYN